MKYLLILAILAGSYYQFYLPKLNEESINEFMADIRSADINKDYETMNDQFSDLVILYQLDKNLEITSQVEIKKGKFIKTIKQLKNPKLNLIEKSEIEKIEVFEEKALVTSLITLWVTVDERRIKRVSREVLTIVIQQASLKVSEVGSYLIKAQYISSSS
jgi:hypothetical protein